MNPTLYVKCLVVSHNTNIFTSELNRITRFEKLNSPKSYLVYLVLIKYKSEVHVFYTSTLLHFRAEYTTLLFYIEPIKYDALFISAAR